MASGLFIVPQVSNVSPIFWRPEDPGVHAIGIALISVVGAPLKVRVAASKLMPGGRLEAL